jgi:predicted GNAT superfamily acetyltransferase
MQMACEIKDLHGEFPTREGLLRVNNASAQETSLLSQDRFDRLIAAARVATFIPPNAAFLLAFEQDDDYDGGHFLWFRSRLDRFLYIDRVVVAQEHRRRGLGRKLYGDLFKRAEELDHTSVVCEVNSQPPNPVSDEFHAAHGFQEIGSATIDQGGKTVRYLLRRR